MPRWFAWSALALALVGCHANYRKICGTAIQARANGSPEDGIAAACNWLEEHPDRVAAYDGAAAGPDQTPCPECDDPEAIDLATQAAIASAQQRGYMLVSDTSYDISDGGESIAMDMISGTTYHVMVLANAVPALSKVALEGFENPIDLSSNMINAKVVAYITLQLNAQRDPGNDASIYLTMRTDGRPGGRIARVLVFRIN